MLVDDDDDDEERAAPKATLATRLKQLIDLPPLWTAGAMVASWAIASAVPPMLPDAVRLSGWILIGLSLLMMLWAVRHMMRMNTAVMPHRKPRFLVRTGPFRYTRNPIYLGDLLIVVGWSMTLGQPLSALTVLPLGYILQKRFIEPEEAKLDRAFDTQFRAWSAEIPRWL
ncbi:MAG: isoprenylcysteine carboxylmethyltransferase family protein [Pseudomonadota bacterium]